MTWQEELRQLDSALAGGELSANEYRKRRDEILAAASSAQPPSPVIGPPTGPRPVITAAAAAAPPPPEVPAPDAAEVTQVVNVESAEPAGEVTQIIANPIKGNNGAQATPAPREEPTSPAIPQPQWASLPPSHNAQTSVSSIPPIPPPPPQVTGPAVTPLDAQDLFTSNKAPAGSRKPVVIGLAVLLALAVVGAGVWFFAFSGDDDSPDTAADTNQTSNEQPTTQALPEPVDITKIELPGELALNSGEMDITRASEMTVIAPAEATLLADAGAQQLTYLGHSEGNYRFLLYAYKSDSAAGAKELTTRISGVQQQLGFTATEVNGVPGTVAVTTFSNPEAVALRGVYTYGDTTIQLSVLQVPVGDLAELHAQFQTAMTAVTDAAPPTE